MAIDFKKLDEQYDIKGLKEEVKDVQENGGGDYPDIPVGQYEVTMTNLELGVTGEKSKNPGTPMVKATFKIVAGEHKNRLIFMNQVVGAAFGIHKADEFLRSLDTGIPIEFNGYADYSELLMDIAEEMEAVEFLLDYGENKSGFNTFEVLEIYE